ncbi:MAG: hypothetical protein IPP78_10475 [Holophagaceae bacterium]|nr:hypothetical protein [Holophagaceae bacterium]
MKLTFPDRHLQPSKRLLPGVAVLAALSTGLLWPAAHRWALLVWILWLPVFALVLRYVAGSWVRISAQRGLSYCLKTPLGTRLGSIELDSSSIAELRLEASVGSRLLGLWSLKIITRDGTTHPPFHFFTGMDRIAEELHGYLCQG